MTGNVRQTPPEPTCGTLWVTSDNSPTFDGTGPQNAPEGTVDMNSIDNLREYVLTAPSICSTTRAILVGYIDEIEREVEEAREREYRNGREDAKGAVEFADRLKAAVDKREDVTLFGVEYTALPLDADGMPIHVGDVLDGYSKTIEVVELRIGRSGWVIVSRDGNAYVDCAAFTHHHAPTVEDVLREFTYGLGVPVADSYVAATAAKLRLAGDE